MKPLTLVSAIITTRNEEGYIGKCVESIRNQTYSQLEIIVVDNSSTDKTAEIVRKLRIPVYRKGPERSTQRNFGARKAKGEIFIFIDADMVLEKSVVSECVLTLRDIAVSSVIIPEMSVGEGFWSECKALERRFYIGIDWIEAARCYRRSAFEAAGGFDEKLTGPEDYDLFQRVKARYSDRSVGRISAFIMHDEGNIHLMPHLRKKIYYGRQMLRYAKKPENRSAFRKQSDLVLRILLFLSQPVMMVRYPLLFMGMMILKILEMTAVSWGHVSGLISSRRQYAA